MGKIVIRKRVGLEFLGEEYKDAYLVFRAVPVSDYVNIEDELKKVEGDNKATLNLFIDYLKRYFLKGEFPNEEGNPEPVEKDDLDGLDADSAMACFQRMTGQVTDPKENETSPNTSLTEAPSA